MRTSEQWRQERIDNLNKFRGHRKKQFNARYSIDVTLPMYKSLIGHAEQVREILAREFMTPMRENPHKNASEVLHYA